MNEEMHRFLSAISVADECWEWTKCRTSRGYGRLGDGEGSGMNAHRKSYELFVGPIPEGLHVLHRCDNPPCVNPRHLFLGTHADNMADMRIKGVHKPCRGEQNGLSKLSADDVRAIRTSIKLPKELAQEFGVTRTRIYQIRNGKGWRHIE